MSDAEKDSLYILPLSIIPLQSAGLRQTHLIKNSQMQGVVELFRDENAGSGQVAPEQLGKVFDLRGPKANDIKIVKSLSVLPSYDVYSLRIELRDLGIEIEQHKDLQLSKSKQQELTDYMMVFTKPLVSFIFEERGSAIRDFQDIVRSLQTPDAALVRKNLTELARRLNVATTDLPAFLEDYGDTYLSLAYYQHCLDQNQPQLKDFFTTIQEVKDENYLKNDQSLLRTCLAVSAKLETTVQEVEDILNLFVNTTLEMWEDFSSSNFGTIKSLIKYYQTRVGGALCAITVKMNAWQNEFPVRQTGSLSRRVDFIVNHIRPSINLIEPIGAAEMAQAG